MNSLSNNLTDPETNTSQTVDNEQRAAQLIAKAEIKLNRGENAFSLSLLGRFVRYTRLLIYALFYPSIVDEAILCYQRAANLYKTAQNWSLAGSAFCQAAALLEKVKDRDASYDAATHYVNASNYYKKSGESNKVISCLIKAVELFKEMGNNSMAARHHQALAELYEALEPADIDRAVQHYEQAAHYYSDVYSENKCLMKVAKYSAQLENYQIAIQTYEVMAYRSLGNDVLQYNSDEYFLRAALCHLCVDLVSAQEAVHLYEIRHPELKESLEYKLVKSLMGQVEKEDGDGFTKTVKEYEFILRKDQWFTTILQRIKGQMAEARAEVSELC